MTLPELLALPPGVMVPRYDHGRVVGEKSAPRWFPYNRSEKRIGAEFGYEARVEAAKMLPR